MPKRAVNPYRSYAQRRRRERERAAYREWVSRPENAAERYKIYAFLVVLAISFFVIGTLTILGFKTR